MPTYSCEITVRKNDYSSLRMCADWLGAHLAVSRMPDMPRRELEFSVNEALANVVDHAYPDLDEHQIHIELAVSVGYFAVTIFDEGVPFDPTTYDRFTPPDTLEDASGRKYGLHMIHEYIDEIRYRRDGVRNVLELVKRVLTR